MFTSKLSLFQCIRAMEHFYKKQKKTKEKKEKKKSIGKLCFTSVSFKRQHIPFKGTNQIWARIDYKVNSHIKWEI